MKKFIPMLLGSLLIQRVSCAQTLESIAQMSPAFNLQAQQALISSWQTEMAGSNLTQEHLAFWMKNGIQVRFSSELSDEICTFDHSSVVASLTMFANDWTAERRQGLPVQATATKLARQTLSTISHCLRDGMMKQHYQSIGLDYPEAFIEEEVVHWTEMAKIQRALEAKYPGLYLADDNSTDAILNACGDPYANSRCHKIDGFVPRETHDAATLTSKEKVLSKVIGAYKLPSLLAMTQQEYLDHLKRNLKNDKSSSDYAIDMAGYNFIKDTQKYDALKKEVTGELAEIGITRMDLCKADQENAELEAWESKHQEEENNIRLGLSVSRGPSYLAIPLDKPSFYRRWPHCNAKPSSQAFSKSSIIPPTSLMKLKLSLPSVSKANKALDDTGN